MAALLVFVAATLAAPYLHLPAVIQFFLSVLAIVPLAGFVGSATEALTARLGSRVGGLFNATFGNAPDILVGVIGLQKGLIVLVKATLIGALISNSALIMGLCYVVAGLRYGRPTFNRREAGHHSILMMLAIGAVLFPSVGAFVTCGVHATCTDAQATPITEISVGIAIVLLVAYFAYLAFGVFGLESISGRTAAEAAKAVQERKAEADPNCWPVWVAVLVLGVATLLLIPVINTLTDRVDSVTSALGISEVFVGMVIVGNAGNAAEAYSAIRLALVRPGSAIPDHPNDSGLDMAIGIASASSIQIAAFVAPIVVLYGLFSHPFNLVFSPIEIGILSLMVLVFTQTAHDGEANWLEGAMLIALYAMAAIVFYALPVSAF
jgi:Ca2+:H+ antiporter